MENSSPSEKKNRKGFLGYFHGNRFQLIEIREYCDRKATQDFFVIITFNEYCIYMMISVQLNLFTFWLGVMFSLLKKKHKYS